MLKARNDYKCKLVAKDGSELLTFRAATLGDLVENASFVGGGIASAGQALTVWTEKAYKYQAFEHSVIIGDTTYKLTAVQRGMRKRLGASCSKIVPVYVLSLE